MNRRSISVALGLLAALALGAVVAGCGSDTTVSVVTSTETVAPTTSSTTSTTTTEATSSTTTDQTTINQGGGGTPPADQTVSSLTGFTSPSGNIGCIIDRKSVRCDIRDRDWSPPPQPASCNENVDYGQGLTISAGGAPDFVCAGDTTLDSGPALAYGQTIGAGLIICDSEESGMTCRDTETGRGFTIAKQAYKLF